MKTALVAGVCLLALTFTITNALDKKQDASPECATLEANATLCIDTSSSSVDCSGSCRTALEEYFVECDDTHQKMYEQACEEDNGDSEGGCAVTVGTTLFTSISAVLVAMGN